MPEQATDPLRAMLVRAVAREAAAHRDVVRLVRAMLTGGTPEHEVQHVVRRWHERFAELRDDPSVGPVPGGFSDDTAYRIAQRYAAGLIPRGQMLEELGRWEYAPPGELPEHEGDDLYLENPGSFDDQVGRALDADLIDDADYEAVLATYRGRFPS
ncbi:hypothetical protein CLV92_11173 [Kineococcus xinjiangensis]|uniref:Uncharacterized protein n=1 Tax=Kineococcus xinjiangensis TaxID=512762 RepID=A0A2S6IG40_9ACTN|nr:hypothetical protein [Kineococcus xinjiangensis]PPK93156.1 hypothetical protein CLV92_11173 [Kineococcus xinjiangensis]